MAVIKTKIELTEEDVKKVLAQYYNLDVDTATLYIYQDKGDGSSYDIGYTTITFEGVKRYR